MDKNKKRRVYAYGMYIEDAITRSVNSLKNSRYLDNKKPDKEELMIGMCLGSLMALMSAQGLDQNKTDWLDGVALLNRYVVQHFMECGEIGE